MRLVRRRASAGVPERRPASHEEHRNRLFATQQWFWGRGEVPSNVAPKPAAEACQFALLGYPLAMVEHIGARAEAAHQEALRLVNIWISSETTCAGADHTTGF